MSALHLSSTSNAPFALMLNTPNLVHGRSVVPACTLNSGMNKECSSWRVPLEGTIPAIYWEAYLTATANTGFPPRPPAAKCICSMKENGGTEAKWVSALYSTLTASVRFKGQEYRGELKNGEHWGRGCMRYKDGSFYVGDWLRGRKHGLGTLYYNNGNWYKGAFCKDAQDGWGIFYWPTVKRKLEGEWVANCLYSGCYSSMTTEDYHISDDFMLKYCPSSILYVMLEAIPEEERQILELRLNRPCWILHNVISSVRKLDAIDKKTQGIYKTQAGRNESLSADQLQALKKAFEFIASCSLQEAHLPVVHLRRLLILSQIDPDKEQGQKLLVHLQEMVKGRSSISFDNFLFRILQFHHP